MGGQIGGWMDWDTIYYFTYTTLVELFLIVECLWHVRRIFTDNIRHKSLAEELHKQNMSGIVHGTQMAYGEN